MKKKIGICSALLLTLVGGNGILAATDANDSDISTPMVQSVFHEMLDENSWLVKAGLSWSGSTYLTSGQWCNVISDNNFFNANVEVTNQVGSPGSITVRIVDGKGNLLVGEQTIAVGTTKRFSGIPWNSGTYIVQAKAKTTGTHFFHVTSRVL
ncbi:hypothetical protein [Turicibacter sp.]|uniref:hypothetical protein n=1 Tax=Turicibacter sp. TaxID=2049042 RepID=UPI001B5A70D1|nr:hypothetical protein [Turicibacter sp.]MBP3904010.1 hypothetical protein [Turicibacter sp.]